MITFTTDAREIAYNLTATGVISGYETMPDDSGQLTIAHMDTPTGYRIIMSTPVHDGETFVLYTLYSLADIERDAQLHSDSFKFATEEEALAIMTQIISGLGHAN